MQIWLQPAEHGIEPSYEEKHFDESSKRGRLRVVASPDRREGSVLIHQDALVYAALLNGSESAVHEIAPGRRAYVHVARGKIDVNGQALLAGDGAKLTDGAKITLDQGDAAEVLLFDLS